MDVLLRSGNTKHTECRDNIGKLFMRGRVACGPGAEKPAYGRERFVGNVSLCC
jgi:hypothetical protein